MDTTLSKLLNDLDRETFRQACERLYPKLAEGLVATFNRMRLIAARPGSEKCTIVLEKVEHGEGTDWYVAALGVSGSAWSIGGHPWAWTLGHKIDPEIFDHLAPAEIAAHCLWEMAYFGFDEEKIKETWMPMLNDPGSGRTQTWEEICAKMEAEMTDPKPPSGSLGI